MPDHRASESWQEECRFWLPDDEEHLVYGHLDYEPTRGPGAHLIDSAVGGGDQELPIPALHGESLGGIPFSLLDLDIESWITQGQGNTVDGRGSLLVRGAHVNSADDLVVDAMHLRLEGLLDVLTGGLMSPQPLLSVSAERNSHDDQQVEFDDGQLLLYAGAGASFSRHKASVELGSAIAGDFSEPLSWPECRKRWVEPIRDLIVFCIRRPSWIETAQIHLASDHGDEPGYRLAGVELIQRPEVPVPTPVPTGRSMLGFNLGAVPDPAETVRAWFDLSQRVGAVWRIYFATLNRPDLPIENWLLNLTAFAEGYHRTLHDESPLSSTAHKAARKSMLAALPDETHRKVYRAPLDYANSQSQAQRIEFMAKRAAAVLPTWSFDVSLFKKQTRDTRNWLTHWGNRKDAVEGEALIALLQRLELVIRINLMLDLGLPPEVAGNQVIAAHQFGGLP